MSYFETSEPKLSSHQLLVPLIELAKQRGIHPDKALKGTKLFYSDFAQPDHVSSFSQLEQTIKNIMTCHLGQDISFVLGQHLLHSICARYASYLFHCSNLKALLAACKQLQGELFPYFSVRMFKQNKAIHLIVNPAISELQPSVYCFLLEVWLSLINGFLKWRFENTQVQFQLPYTTPVYIEEYQAIGANLLSFGHHFTTVVISKEALQTRQNSAIPALQSDIKTLANSNTVGFLAYAESFLIANPRATLEDLANYFNTSGATLKRKLALHNSQFSCLKDRVLSQQAGFCIGQQGYSNSQVAKVLDFNDLPNFRRAIKRWFGVTPSELRKVRI
ncbi:helix-turn-helix domain-containing protein [Pseudoalteromonas luteoviolacea]|uniref:AraC-type DNA-binding domain-containing protein n=1 Tax=Pseudoalteromonas luteoviolacea (strain 2ta16) TaxID=1353533 RepID=V4JDJ0_PSEL2|nr:helix-turn-helix domain-containing protein [Pseudoalteromonas luteoviolacea]ESP93142.1 AraC-type DNA-binding domain-containing protein [Pseudoalteromonas luteoviolacea 2ta16]KZN37015.1 hypothetical protein N483_21455 [Pseudoalteromonas luteoviolacea NCIMB 1944]